MKHVSIEQQLDLVKKLKECYLYYADIEYRAPVKTDGFTDGLDNMRRAADFIESIATQAKAGAEDIGERWAAIENLFNP